VLFDQKLGGGIINFVKESAQAFTKLENYDLAFQLLVFHKLSNTKLPANPNTSESTLLKKSDGKKVDNLTKVENEKPFKIIETLEGKNKSVEGARILKGTIASSGSTLEVNISMIYKSKDYTGKVFANLIKKIELQAADLGLSKIQIEWEYVINEKLSTAAWAKEYGYTFSSVKDKTDNLTVIWTKNLDN
ncbi:MAG: hypothetical protein O9353_13455, partial [Bacteroidia bacterium]|nr:hypothetical protein [Bacteroidia bacterium]